MRVCGCMCLCILYFYTCMHVYLTCIFMCLCMGTCICPAFVSVYLIFPQQRIRLWGLQSAKERRGDRGFGSRVPDSVRYVCVLDCRNWIWHPQVNNHLSLGAARDRSSPFDGTCLFARGERSNARGVRTQQSLSRNIFFAHGERSKLVFWRETAAVFSPEHASLRTE